MQKKMFIKIGGEDLQLYFVVSVNRVFICPILKYMLGGHNTNGVTSNSSHIKHYVNFYLTATLISVPS